MDLPRRAGAFVNELSLEDLEKELFTDAPLAPSLDAISSSEASEILEPIERDEDFLSRLKEQDPNEQIRRTCVERLAKESRPGDASVREARNRSYRNTPNVEAYAVDSGELKRLAAASRGVKVVVNSAVPVGLWHYEKCDATCVFCYEQLMGPCHKCLSNETPASQCKIAIGECGHPIHIDCQNSWSGKSKCMTCQQVWNVKSEYSVFGPGISLEL